MVPVSGQKVAARVTPEARYRTSHEPPRHVGKTAGRCDSSQERESSRSRHSAARHIHHLSKHSPHLRSGPALPGRAGMPVPKPTDLARRRRSRIVRLSSSGGARPGSPGRRMWLATSPPSSVWPWRRCRRRTTRRPSYSTPSECYRAPLKRPRRAPCTAPGHSDSRMERWRRASSLVAGGPHACKSAEPLYMQAPATELFTTA